MARTLLGSGHGKRAELLDRDFIFDVRHVLRDEERSALVAAALLNDG
jgi:hypothetical protein